MVKAQTSDERMLDERQLKQDLVSIHARGCGPEHEGNLAADRISGHIDALAKRLEKARADIANITEAWKHTAEERDVATTQLIAWQTAFGTTQLTHAMAERDAQAQLERETQEARDLANTAPMAVNLDTPHIPAIVRALVNFAWEAVNDGGAGVQAKELAALAERVTALEKAARAVVEAAPGYTAKRGSVWKLDYALDALRAVLDPPALDAQAKRIAALEGALESVQSFDPGLLNDYGGGKVDWWQDYIRSLLAEVQALAAFDRKGE